MSKDKLNQAKRKIESVQALMIAYVTGERTNTQPTEYQEAYYQLDVELKELGLSNPNQHRSLESFWSFCKLQEMNDYASRRAYVRDLYGDVLLDVEHKLRKIKEPRNWKRANETLTDQLEPVRRQWGKARNYIYSTPPDFENSIKESINSVESTIKILTGDTNSTLGQLIKRTDIDPDIRRVISQVYGLLSSKAFVRHGSTKSENISEAEAEFFLEFAAIAILYLKQKLE